METLIVVFLGLIALSSVVQTAFLIGVAREGKRLGQRLDELQRRFETEIRPSLENISRISKNLAGASEILSRQVTRVDDLLADTIAKVEDTTSALRRTVLRPLGPILDIAALFKGVQRGYEIYKRLGGIEGERKGNTRRYSDDEHLFI